MAAGIGKPKVQAAIAAGMGKTLGRVEGKKGGIYRLRNDGPVRDSPSQSATSRTADSDSCIESAIRSTFDGLDRNQPSGKLPNHNGHAVAPNGSQSTDPDELALARLREEARQRSQANDFEAKWDELRRFSQRDPREPGEDG